jgi:hypothetical protein
VPCRAGTVAIYTHVHKVIYMVVSTFEQGLKRWRSRGGVSH